jgi:hypothetical protein
MSWCQSADVLTTDTPAAKRGRWAVRGGRRKRQEKTEGGGGEKGRERQTERHSDRKREGQTTGRQTQRARERD